MENTFTGDSMPDSMLDDMFEGGPDLSDTTVDTPADETPADETAPTETTPDTPDAPAEAADAPTDEKPAVEETTEDLPEGVTVRERNGRKEWVYPEERAKSIYGGYKLAQEAEAIIGEPLTQDALASRQQAHEWLESQRVDSFSPNPAEQANVFRNIFREAAGAIANGDIGHDPLTTMGEAFMTTLAEMAPEHFQTTQMFVMQGVLENLYREAAASGSEKLMRSAQNLDHHLNGKYRDDNTVKSMASKVTPIDQREAQLTERERAIQNHQQSQERAAYNGWHKSTASSITQGVQGVLAQQIPADVKAAFEAAPGGQQRLANIHKLLDIEVRDAMRKDQKWSEGVDNLFKQAKMAPTEQRRAAIQQQIVQRYEQKARQTVQAKAKAIIDAETAGIKNANSALHKKLQAGQEQKGGTGVAKPATRSIPSNLPPNATWEQFVDAS